MPWGQIQAYEELKQAERVAAECYIGPELGRDFFSRLAWLRQYVAEREAEAALGRWEWSE